MIINSELRYPEGSMTGVLPGREFPDRVSLLVPAFRNESIPFIFS